MPILVALLVLSFNNCIPIFMMIHQQILRTCISLLVSISELRFFFILIVLIFGSFFWLFLVLSPTGLLKFIFPHPFFLDYLIKSTFLHINYLDYLDQSFFLNYGKSLWYRSWFSESIVLLMYFRIQFLQNFHIFNFSYHFLVVSLDDFSQ